MIKSVVFDMGNVLVVYDPKQTMLQDGLTPKQADVICGAVFASAEWVALDRGTIEKADAFAVFKSRLPEDLWAYLEPKALRQSWMDHMPPYAEMFHLVTDLKRAGYGVYLLSNAGSEFHSYFKNYPVMELMDGKIISADHHFLKPEPELYRVLFDTFALRPEECLFVDDMRSNIDGAARVGMSGICFSPSRERVNVLREKLCEAGVKI
ncbi:MAG: HAD family phosphatase [Oscillospiraceae bacterium]|jgi:putative hydrolase of the HAD superfamily|nr:HAD family phosphatase [Oscillospiraceae bacterium]